MMAREGDAHLALLEECASVAHSIAALRGPMFAAYLKAVDVGDNHAIASSWAAVCSSHWR